VKHLSETRQLASPKQRRGAITTDEDVERIFEHLKKAKPEPAHPTNNPWELKPFRGIIRGDFHQSSLPHDVEVVIKNGMQYADYLNISKRNFLYLIYTDFPQGVPKKSKTLADAKVAEYDKTLCTNTFRDIMLTPLLANGATQAKTSMPTLEIYT
jgi:Asp-tRNA(Asn)/Glu-tRNA(Gln) amidotransferase C subunit